MTYCYKCHVCGETSEVFRSMSDSDKPKICSCGKRMKRDYRAEHSAVRGDYNEKIISDSMAFDATDLDEHRKRFPNIEVVVDHARSARPVFNSLAQKRKYLKARRWVDCNSFF